MIFGKFKLLDAGTMLSTTRNTTRSPLVSPVSESCQRQTRSGEKKLIVKY